ncbi:MAG: protein kinase, partial [Acidobacteriota bacterium]|nr:protein kinase [Acidobacteriota bacterium]
MRQSDGKEQVVLIDFGIARPTGGDGSDALRTMTAVGLGTVAYAAPEQFSGSGKVTAACDVHAFAVVAYELLTGRRPYGEMGLGAALEEQRRGGLKERVSAVRPEVTEEVDELLAAGLRYEAARGRGIFERFRDGWRRRCGVRVRACGRWRRARGRRLVGLQVKSPRELA